MASQLWAPFTRTSGEWLASKSIQGFFAAPSNTLCVVSITDIYYQHEHGTFMALYAFMIGASNFIAPIYAGFIEHYNDWRWVLVFVTLNLIFKQ
jgi:MFS family permease